MRHAAPVLLAVLLAPAASAQTATGSPPISTGWSDPLRNRDPGGDRGSSGGGDGGDAGDSGSSG